MVKQIEKGFYIGTFHNDNNFYIDPYYILIGKPEIFEVDDLGYGTREVFRLDDNFHYDVEDFKDVSYIGEGTRISASTGIELSKDDWYWVKYPTLDTWEVVKSIGLLKLKRIGINGIFSTKDLEASGPRIDLVVHQTQVRHNYKCIFMEEITK